MTKILFIGLAESSHTTSWIELLENSKFEYRLFALPTGSTPDSIKIPVHLSAHRFLFKPKNFNVKRISVIARFKSFILFIKFKLYVQYVRIKKKLNKSKSNKLFSSDNCVSPSLISVIKSFRPDIVHTLGIFNASLVFDNVQDRFPSIKWVMQVRGGPDLDYFYLDENKKATIGKILSRTDYIICDSQFNYDLARKLGANISQMKLGVVSGTGGVNISLAKEFEHTTNIPTVIWPKAHEGISSKALPILEGIKMAWDGIKVVNFKIFCLDQEEIEFWIQKNMPLEIRKYFQVYGRINRQQFLGHLSKAQVLLSPSIMDGVPNVLLESMAHKVIPIVSPLESIKGIVSDPENVHFARNLYPNEIAKALVNSLSDKSGNQIKIQNNINLIKSNYERSLIRTRVLNFYSEITEVSKGKNS